jgi:hypothetical protein
MIKFNYADCDDLFQWNALEYAFENKSFVSVEMILETYDYSREELHQYSEKYINNYKFVFFCLTHGCTKLLSSILENSHKFENYFKLYPLTIIEHTITNCYFQENETLCFVIGTLGHKYGFNVNSQNRRGRNCSTLSCKVRKNVCRPNVTRKRSIC